MDYHRTTVGGWIGRGGGDGVVADADVILKPLENSHHMTIKLNDRQAGIFDQAQFDMI